MATEEFQSPQNQKHIPKASVSVENGGTREIIISPGFRSVAAMAGWDEEALLCATLIVEDTPERESKHKKRVNLQLKTPPTYSRRKRRAPRVTPASNPIVVLNLDDDELTVEKKEKETKKTEPNIEASKEKKIEDEVIEKRETSPAQNSVLPCMDKLREELSCAICLEICFEPSTTPCGHSFCKKCLKSAADKCGKRCPKCRQLIGNGRSCTINTILWNTIQLLFPQEVEARKAAAGVMAMNSREVANRSPEDGNHNVRTRRAALAQPHVAIDRMMSSSRSRRGTPSQAEDAALAFRLQREEFMEAFRGTDERAAVAAAPRISSARANIRAMASRAINHRIRGRPI